MIESEIIGAAEYLNPEFSNYINVTIVREVIDEAVAAGRTLDMNVAREAAERVREVRRADGVDVLSDMGDAMDRYTGVVRDADGRGHFVNAD